MKREKKKRIEDCQRAETLQVQFLKVPRVCGFVVSRELGATRQPSFLWSRKQNKPQQRTKRVFFLLLLGEDVTGGDVRGPGWHEL